MWVPPEITDPILRHAPTRKSVACFGAGVQTVRTKLHSAFRKMTAEATHDIDWTILMARAQDGERAADPSICAFFMTVIVLIGVMIATDVPREHWQLRRVQSTTYIETALKKSI